MKKENKKKKQKKGSRGKKNSVQELLGIQHFTKYGLMTEHGELVFFQIAPTNISVLSYDNIERKISHLQGLISMHPDLEIVCTDSCECFDGNREYLRRRALEEPNSQVRSILEQDREMLSQMQSEMSNARQFYLVMRFRNLKPEMVFTAIKDFTDAEVDTIEIMLSQLYQNFGLTEKTDFSKLEPTDYPVLSDLYELCIQEYHCYDVKRKPLYTEETLRNICLGLNSVCVGSESRFFNGHTNIQDNMFLVFGVKGVMDLNKKLRCAIEFNILSYMTHQLLSVGNCVAALDELYLFLDSPVTIEYIRNNMKRVRKKDSSMVLASQNIEDFLIPNIREMTKPLFSIPTHQFLFNPGQINPRDYMDALQVEQAEYDLIHSCERGHNLYRCGNERYLLQVIAPEHKVSLFGTAGGR